MSSGNDEWEDTNEEFAVGYALVRVENDGTEIFIAVGAVPEGIPVEKHVLHDVQVKAIYADGQLDLERYPCPKDGESLFLSGGKWVKSTEH